MTTISPYSADLVERAIRDTDLIAAFADAADCIYHTPAGPYLAVSASIDAALEAWAWDVGLPSAAISAAQRDAVTATLTARCWAEYEANPTLPFGRVYDALCQANDARRGMSV